jgi:streptogramin lyase
VWTATCNEPGLARIDPKSNKVTGRLKLAVPSSGSEGSIGVGAGSVWVVVDGRACTACKVARIDPEHLQVMTSISVTEGAAAVRYGDGAVWVTNPVENLVEKIDPKRERVMRRIKVGPQPRFMAVGEGAAWTLNQLDGTVTRIDPNTGKTTTIVTPFVGEGGDIAAGQGWIWPRGSSKLLGRIDPRTNQLVDVYGPDSGSGAVIVGYKAVWVSAHDVDAVWRLPLLS